VFLGLVVVHLNASKIYRIYRLASGKDISLLQSRRPRGSAPQRPASGNARRSIAQDKVKQAKTA
jgi:hypothetical protein